MLIFNRTLQLLTAQGFEASELSILPTQTKESQVQRLLKEDMDYDFTSTD